jgi:hypothetical protein
MGEFCCDAGVVASDRIVSFGELFLETDVLSRAETGFVFEMDWGGKLGCLNEVGEGCDSFERCDDVDPFRDP